MKTTTFYEAQKQIALDMADAIHLLAESTEVSLRLEAARDLLTLQKACGCLESLTQDGAFYDEDLWEDDVPLTPERELSVEPDDLPL